MSSSYMQTHEDPNEWGYPIVVRSWFICYSSTYIYYLTKPTDPKYCMLQYKGDCTTMEELYHKLRPLVERLDAFASAWCVDRGYVQLFRVLVAYARRPWERVGYVLPDGVDGDVMFHEFQRDFYAHIVRGTKVLDQDSTCLISEYVSIDR